MGMREWDGEKWVHKSGGIGTGGSTGEIPSKLPNPYPLIINGQSYDGQETVDFTETINGMIDDKLGVIENGAY